MGPQSDTDVHRLQSVPAAHALRAYIELFHLPPILMVLLATTAFATIAADGQPPAGRLAPYLLAVLATQMAIGVHNDYCDRRLDALAKPWRALPAGLVSPAFALELVLVLTGVGLALALPLGSRLVALGAIGTGAGFSYNARLKGTAFAWLPVWVALPALAIASFELVHQYRSQLLLSYVIGLPLVVSVYLADTMIDVESDRRLGVRGLVASLGETGARLLCWASLAAGYLLALALWPSGGSPGLLSALSVALLIAAIVSDRAGVRRVHWLAIMLAVIALAADWLGALPAVN
jgi:4-hydroxybenzoate polyprenyltransferase